MSNSTSWVEVFEINDLYQIRRLVVRESGSVTWTSPHLLFAYIVFYSTDSFCHFWIKGETRSKLSRSDSCSWSTVRTSLVYCAWSLNLTVSCATPLTRQRTRILQGGGGGREEDFIFREQFGMAIQLEGARSQERERKMKWSERGGWRGTCSL